MYMYVCTPNTHYISVCVSAPSITNKQCNAPSGITFEADLLILYSAVEAGQTINQTCYCVITSDVTKPQQPGSSNPDVGVYENQDDVHNELLRLAGPRDWLSQSAEDRDVILFHVTSGDNSTVVWPAQKRAQHETPYRLVQLHQNQPTMPCHR